MNWAFSEIMSFEIQGCPLKRPLSDRVARYQGQEMDKITALQESTLYFCTDMNILVKENVYSDFLIVYRNRISTVR